jgi:chromosomal replication initiation ATPase DnaA
LTLPFNPGASFARTDLYVGRANRAVVEFIDRWPDWPAPVVVLTGAEASGKSHLSAIMAEALGGRRFDTASIDWHAVAAELGAGRLAGGGVLHEGPPGSDRGRLIIVEDAGVGLDEAGLFHLINAVLGGAASLVLTARTPPSEWRLAVPDLVSRLRAATPIVIDSPDDATLEAILVKHFADRQTVVDPAVITFSVSRMERSYAAAQKLVADLDRAAIARKSAVTRALVAEVLASNWSEPLLPGLEGDPAD